MALESYFTENQNYRQTLSNDCKKNYNNTNEC